ncbi:MAG: 1-acyl-sn-glycerol-3-phosphate acyltransferase [Spirochaetia bacterium]|nr:1-acyl-sn-glycerol-3-phosphate acyltransferase [Spirochaetia bacterium]
MSFILRFIFFVLLIRPIIKIIIGLNVRHRERIPHQGPMIVASNHNSHLDVMVLVSLFPVRLLPKIRPVAAADYFMRNKIYAWFSTKIIGIIPLSRSHLTHKTDPLAPIGEALEKNCIVIIFPEGSRGEPEKMSNLRSGIAHIAKRYPEVPTLPVFLHGLGKILPRNESLFVPFYCDVFIGETFLWKGDKAQYMDHLQNSLSELSHEEQLPEWV